MPAPEGGFREAVCDLFEHLMGGPKTRADLLERLYWSENILDQWIKVLRRRGLIRVVGKQGRARVWALQPAPFALPDVET